MVPSLFYQPSPLQPKKKKIAIYLAGQSGERCPGISPSLDIIGSWHPKQGLHREGCCCHFFFLLVCLTGPYEAAEREILLDAGSHGRTECEWATFGSLGCLWCVSAAEVWEGWVSAQGRAA